MIQSDNLLLCKNGFKSNNELEAEKIAEKTQEYYKKVGYKTKKRKDFALFFCAKYRLEKRFLKIVNYKPDEPDE